MGRPWNNQADDPFDETVISPRFDQKAVSGARPVVPITVEREDEITHTAEQKFRQPRASSLISFPKPSWPLALVITLALFVVTAGAVVVKRRSSMPSQYQEPVSATAYAVIGGESVDDAQSSRRAERTVQRPGSRGRNDYDQGVYYSVVPPGKVEPNRGRDEDRGKFEKGEGSGEEKRRDKEEKWRDKEKERGKDRRGKGRD